MGRCIGDERKVDHGYPLVNWDDSRDIVTDGVESEWTKLFEKVN